MNTTEQIIIHHYPLVETKDQPWDIETCAKYLGMSKSRFSQTIAPSQSFPRSFKLAGGHPRWMSGEVIEWVKKQHEIQTKKRKHDL